MQSSFIIIMSSLAILFLLYFSLHACNARRLGFVGEEIGNHVDFLASKDVNKLKPHKLEMGTLVSIELQTKELQEVGAHGGRRIIGANTVRQTLLNSFLQAKEAVAKAISGYEIMSSSLVDLQSMEEVEGSKRVMRSMLGNSAADAEEALDSKETDNVGEIDVMDYPQPHRKPPIHNEKIKTQRQS